MWLKKLNQPSFYRTQELKILEAEIRMAKQFLSKQTFFTSKKIYLILGPATFGKSTLLSHSNIGLVDHELKPISTEVGETKNCVFWYSSGGIFVDTTGVYTQAENKDYSSREIWTGLIYLLRKYFGKYNLRNLLLVLDLPRMAGDANYLEQSLTSFSNRIYETFAQIGQLELYLLFSKCDRISGFKEFFGNLTVKEAEQAFGLLFTRSPRNLMFEFRDKFSQLADGLHQKAIGLLLSGGIDVQKRKMLQVFPIEFRNLENSIAKIVKSIPNGQLVALNGLFFTSSCQKDQALGFTTKNFFKRLGLEFNPNNRLIKNRYPYFIHQAFSLILEKPVEGRKIDNFLSFGTKLISLGLAILFILWIGYWQSSERLAEARRLLVSSTFDSVAQIEQVMKGLDSLQIRGWVGKFCGLDRITSLKKRLLLRNASITNAALQKEIALLLQKQIDQKEVLKVADTLEAYLCLGNLKKHAKKLEIWGKKQLTFNWCYMGTTKLDPLDEDLVMAAQQLLIDNARDSLFGQTKRIKREIILGGKWISVPEIFLKEQFDQFYQEGLGKFVFNLPHLPDQNLSGLVERMQKVYKEEYRSYWLKVLVGSLKEGSLKVEDLQNLLQAGQWKEILQGITDNLPDDPDFISLREQLTLENWEKFQQEVKKILKFMQETVIPKYEAIKWLKNYYRTQGKNWRDFTNTLTLVSGYESILEEMRVQLLEEIKKQIRLEISYEWNQKVVKEYRRLIANYYPFNKKSEKDLPLSNLVEFFGPDKFFEDFLNRYLSPFVINNALGWEWKVLEGKSLNLGDIFLEAGNRGMLIQRAFYANQRISPEFSFSLANLLGERGNNLSLSIGEDKVNFQEVPVLTWPMRGKDVVLTYSAEDKLHVLSRQGDWAWFKLLDCLKIKHLRGGKYLISFNSYQFNLITNRVNPFIPSLLTDFTCKSVVEK